MQKWIMAILFYGAIVLGVGILLYNMPTPPSEEELAEAENTLEIVAVNWAFDQAEYVVEVGSTKTVKLVNDQGTHGIEIKGLGVVLEGANLSQEVTFSEPGEYEIICNVLCGDGHTDMISKLIVQ